MSGPHCAQFTTHCPQLGGEVCVLISTYVHVIEVCDRESHIIMCVPQSSIEVCDIKSPIIMCVLQSSIEVCDIESCVSYRAPL